MARRKKPENLTDEDLAAVKLPEPQTTKKRAKYDESWPDLVRGMAMLGATDEEMAEALGVSLSALKEHIKRYPELEEARADGKLRADARVAKSLYDLAVGHYHPAVHVSVYEGVVTEYVYQQFKPADARAAFNWLRNRRPDQWRDRQEQTGPGGGPQEMAVTVTRKIVRPGDV